ncbi:MAG: prophage maintenance system killer protein [Neolewinella sp.]|jgi:prophage maintenance system killer protein
MIDYLNGNDIVHINERTIRAHGGKFEAPHNLVDEEALAPIVESIANQSFNHLGDAAAAYLFQIIRHQPFLQANERTALQAARTFVHLNGGAFHKKIKAVEVDGRRVPSEGNGREIWVKLVLEVRDGSVSLENLIEFMSRNIRAK